MKLRGLLLLLICFSSVTARAEYFYFLPVPVETKSEVPTWSRVLGWTLGVGVSTIRATTLLLAGKPYAAAGFYVLDVGRSPLNVAGWYLLDLQLRERANNRALLAEFDGVPGVQRAFALSGGEYKRWGIFLTAREGTALRLIETDKPLPQEILDGQEHPDWKSEWGKPIAIVDPELAKIHFSLSIDGKEQAGAMSIPLSELKGDPRLSPELLEQWNAAVKAAPRNAAIGMDAWAEHPTLGRVDLGRVAEGGGVKNILGVGAFAKSLNLVRIVKRGRLPLIERRPSPLSAACRIDYQALALFR